MNVKSPHFHILPKVSSRFMIALAGMQLRAKKKRWQACVCSLLCAELFQLPLLVFFFSSASPAVLHLRALGAQCKTTSVELRPWRRIVLCSAKQLGKNPASRFADNCTLLVSSRPLFCSQAGWSYFHLDSGKRFDSLDVVPLSNGTYSQNFAPWPNRLRGEQIGARFNSHSSCMVVVDVGSLENLCGRKLGQFCSTIASGSSLGALQKTNSCKF